MTITTLKFDEINVWSELKLEIIENYGAAYTKAFANQKGLKKYYIDAFSGLVSTCRSGQGDRLKVVRRAPSKYRRHLIISISSTWTLTRRSTLRHFAMAALMSTS